MTTLLDPTESTITISDQITVDLVHANASDLAVVRAARVSTLGGEADAEDKGAGYNAGLISYLMKDRHGSPFEHTHMTFLVVAPIFTVRHLMRHRTWSFNEESARYKEIEPAFYLPGRNRSLIQTGKPGKYQYHSAPAEMHEELEQRAAESFSESYRTYQELLSIGVSRELARMVLPVSTFTSLYATCNARSLMHFLSLRTTSPTSKYKSYPQAEIESVAGQMEALFIDLMPMTHRAFEEFGRVAP